MRRSSYQQSYERFIELTGGNGVPRLSVERRPRHDDDRHGPSLCRMLPEECALERVTLPGLFAGRSELVKVSFSGSDLHRSTLCWNDFRGCWFDQCDLRDSDLRSSWFVDCDFSGADLSDCDIRRATFERCKFAGASMAGAVAANGQRASLGLTAEQAASMQWHEDPGPEPDGG